MQRHTGQTYSLDDLLSEEGGRSIDFAPAVSGPVCSMAMRPSDRMINGKYKFSNADRLLTQDEDCLAMHGWLSPQGIMYAAAFKKHEQVAGLLGYDSECHIEEAGFCKLANLKWFVSGRYRSLNLSDEQWSYIENWFVKNEYPLTVFQKLTTI